MEFSEGQPIVNYDVILKRRVESAEYISKNTWTKTLEEVEANNKLIKEWETKGYELYSYEDKYELWFKGQVKATLLK